MAGAVAATVAARGGRVCRAAVVAALLLLVSAATACGTAGGAQDPATTAPSGPAAVAPGGVPVVPYQYVAKAYTELLGRAPTPAEWRLATAYFTRSGCSPASLRAFGLWVVGSAEYARDYPLAQGGRAAAAVTLTLYRFVLNREPDATGFVANRDALATGRVSAVGAAGNLFATPEFLRLTEPAICSPTNPSYYFGQPGNLKGFPAIATPAQGPPGPDRPEAPLQAALEILSAAGGGTYRLPPGAVFGLSTTLVVPGNVTLTTDGNPDPTRYADMAELARLAGFTGLPGYPGRELVRLQPGARLLHVWVDGQRDAPAPSHFLQFDVRMLGGGGTTVRNDRLGNTEGASTLEDDGGHSNVPGATACTGNVVSHNLLEAYSSTHVDPPGAGPTDHPQADGLGIYCTHTQVQGNQIVDISDSAVVLFDGSSLMGTAPPQLSDVWDNTVISAGNSYSFGIVTDPSYSLHAGPLPGGDAPGVVTRNFSSGSRYAWIHTNVLWSGSRTHFAVVLSAGTHDLFGSTFHQNCSIPNQADQADCGGGRNATGARWTGNSSAGLPIRAEIGLYVGGSVTTVMLGNRFADLVEVHGGFCPKYPVVVVPPFATGLRIDQPVHQDTAMASDSCVNPRY